MITNPFSYIMVVFKILDNFFVFFFKNIFKIVLKSLVSYRLWWKIYTPPPLKPHPLIPTPPHQKKGKERGKKRVKKKKRKRKDTPHHDWSPCENITISQLPCVNKGKRGGKRRKIGKNKEKRGGNTVFPFQ